MLAGPTTTSKKPASLLVIVPGAFLYPKDYFLLVNALSSDLYVSVAAINWTAVTTQPSPLAHQESLARAIEDAIQQAKDTLGFVEHNFDLQIAPSSSNIFVALHSVAALVAPVLAKTARRYAGIILMGSTLQALPEFWPSSQSFSVPLLHLLGERDGQAHAVHAAIAYTHAFQCAPCLGLDATSLYRPFILLPGVNHACFSNGVVNVERGDLTTELSVEDASESIATALLHFITVHEVKESTKRKKESTQYLVDQTIDASQFFTPYLQSLGRASTSSLPYSSTHSSSLSDHATHALIHAYGPEMIFLMNPVNAHIAHPGELVVAETHAIAVQKELLHPHDATAVMCTVHTIYESFITSSPSIHRMPLRNDNNTSSGIVLEDGLVVNVQCLVERMIHAEKRQGSAVSEYKPVGSISPVYSLKLLTHSLLDDDVDADGTRDIKKYLVDNEHIVQSMAIDMNTRMWQAATERMKGSKIEDRYINLRGKGLSFALHDGYAAVLS